MRLGLFPQSNWKTEHGRTIRLQLAIALRLLESNQFTFVNLDVRIGIRKRIGWNTIDPVTRSHEQTQHHWHLFALPDLFPMGAPILRGPTPTPPSPPTTCSFDSNYELVFDADSCFFCKSKIGKMKGAI